MVKSTTVEHLPLWKRILRAFIVGIVFLIVIVFGFLVFKIVYEQPPEDMIKISDQFASRGSWRLVSSRVEPVRVLCVDVGCPSVWKQWKTETLLTRTDLENVLHNSGWDFKIKGTCTLSDPNYFGNNIDVCSASGVINNYSVDISVSSSNPSKNYLVGLSINKVR